jgi:acetyltransferase-like isoleucine patch superfamily enzyme
MNLGGRFLTEKDLKDVPFRKIGSNVKIHERASIYGVENISIGNNVRIDDFTLIVAVNGYIEIGSYVQICSHCFLGCNGGVVLDDFVVVSPGTRIFSACDDYSGKKLTGISVPREYTGGLLGKVMLKKHVIIGANSVILPCCSIGEGASIGALSLVNKDLDPWGMYAGVPVRRIKDRGKDLLVLEQKLLAR